jgi:hypothetical protein
MINIHASFYYADSFKKCESNQQKIFHFFVTTDSSDHIQMTANQGLAQENNSDRE